MNDTMAATNLAGAIADAVGSKMASEVMRLIEREPDLLLDYLHETGRLRKTGLAYIEARPGYKWASTESERADHPAGAVRATEHTHPSLYLWLVR